MLGAEERWMKHIILNILAIRNSVFALRLVNKGLGSQVRVKVFTGLARAVHSGPSHGIKKAQGIAIFKNNTILTVNRCYK